MPKRQVKYSIIIPCYTPSESDFRRCLYYIKNQTVQPFEVIVVDDASPTSVPQIAKEYGFTYIRHDVNKNNGGARNTGIRAATGDYLVFCNADDYFELDAIEQIDKVNKGQDLIIVGLQAFGALKFSFIPNKDNTPYLSKLDMNGEPMHVVNRKFFIRNSLWEIENKFLVDVEWVRRLEKCVKTFTYVPKVLYMYQTGHESSTLTQIGQGKIISDRQEMLKKDRYLIYSYHVNSMGGVETYIKNKIKRLHKYFDITFVYKADNSDKDQLAKIAKYAKVERDTGQIFVTDICEYASCWGSYPNVKAAKKVQTLHASFKFLRDNGLFTPKFPNDIDFFVSVSKNTAKEVKEVFGIDSTVIYNLLDEVKVDKLLKLMTLSRITPQKGFERMLTLCQKLKDAEKSFVWYIYCDMPKNCYTTEVMDKFKDYPEVVFLHSKSDITNHMADMDYGVLLSDAEGLPYAVYEFLQLNVPCLVTDFGSARELVTDGVNGYVFKMDMSDTEKMFKIPKFKFKDRDPEMEKRWIKLLNKPVGKKVKKYKGKCYKVYAIKDFHDMSCNLLRTPTSVYEESGDNTWIVDEYRYHVLIDGGYAKLNDIMQAQGGQLK